MAGPKGGALPSSAQKGRYGASMTYAVSSTYAPDGRAGSPENGGEPSLDIWSLAGRVWARKGFLFLFMCAAMALAYAALSTVSPRYTGEVRVLIEGIAPDPTNPLGNQTVREADQQKIESEIQVLLSRSLADDVVSTLKLEEWDEFASSSTGFLGLGGSRSNSKSDVMDAYFSRLNVYQIGTSRVIAIDFWAEHPRSATIIANAIADIYIADQLNQQVTVTRRASSWLDQQVEKLRAQVKASEDAVSEYRRKTGLIESNGNTLKSAELSELNTQLILARAAKSEAQARLDSARMLMESPSGIETSSEVLDSSLIQQLREQEVALQRQITELSADLLPQHPDMIARQAELDDLRRAIGDEVGKIVRRLENEVRVAAARESLLRQSIARLKSEVTREKQREGELRALEREAAANRGLLESFLLRASETGARDDRLIQRPEARIISRAETPQSPSFPQKGPVLMLAFMASLTIGLLLILAFEMFAPVPRPVAVREAGRGPRVTTAPPVMAQPAYQPAPPASYAMSASQQVQVAPVHPMAPPPMAPPGQGGFAPAQPTAPVTQMIARLPAGAYLTPHDQWLLGEGAKTILQFVRQRPAINRGGHLVRVSAGRTGARGLVGLARLLSQTGASVLVIGCAPSRAPGFTDLICGRASLGQVMQAESQSRVCYVDWGTIPIHDDPALIRSTLAGLSNQASIILVADADSVVAGLSMSIDRACDTGLVLVSAGDRAAPSLPMTPSAGLVQVG
jgi:uncharacterized protein involved in exopolysaccharide biosynthesis